MNEELDLDFDLEPVVDVNNVKEEIPEAAGVYIGYNQTRAGNFHITYVGRSRNLQRRLSHHPTPCTHFSFEIIEEGNIYEGSAEDIRKKREKELIRKLSPGFNHQYNDGKQRDYILILSNGKKFIGEEVEYSYPPSGENEVKIRRELRDLSTKKEGDKL